MIRNMSRSQNDDASSSKSLKTSDNSGLSPWSNLDQDLLFPIMMELGPVDYYAFSGVCKSWRSLALAHKSKFMGSRRPMSISFSTSTEKECYLEDFKGRKFKIILPNSNGYCVGLTCGYLIFFRRITRDFWLVNLFTRHEFHFPNFPFDVNTNPSMFRGILVFSPSTHRWVFLFSQKFSDTIFFSLSCNQGVWYHLSSQFRIFDIISFKGKIYTLTTGSCLFELKLNRKPNWTLLGMKNFPQPDLLRPEFVKSGKNLYVVSCISKDVYEAYEIDFEKMEWVPTEKPIVEYAFFVGDWKSSAAINPDNWADRGTRYERFGYLKDIDKSKIKGRCFIADIWYFPHDCFNVNPLWLQ